MKDSPSNYLRDLQEIRSIMERSTRFLSLSGWAGIVAGLTALIGAYLATHLFGFAPQGLTSFGPSSTGDGAALLFFASGIFVTAFSAAVYFSWRRAHLSKQSLWNATSKRLLGYMLIPMGVGAVAIILLAQHGLYGLAAPLSLLFYGLALIHAGTFTQKEVTLLGMSQLVLGLLNLYMLEHGLLFWSLGFGWAHIVYGIYMYIRYER